MSNKLDNLHQIKKLIDGDHISQSKTSVSMIDPSDKTGEYPIGHEWTDEDGNTYIQKKGFKIMKTKIFSIREEENYSKLTNHSSSCPKCNKTELSAVDHRFINLRGHCLTCNIAHEHELLIEGEYEKYERSIMKMNAISWLEDAERDLNKLIEDIKTRNEKGISFIGDNGYIETWLESTPAQEVIDKLVLDFNEFKHNILKPFEDDRSIS
jgi:hypothetical protein